MTKKPRLFPTRSGKMVDIGTTRRDEHGVYGYEATRDRRTGKYVAVAVFVPVSA
jgi:hypothetical protein